MRKTVMFLCALMISVTAAFAQVKVTGVVTDAADGLPFRLQALLSRTPAPEQRQMQTESTLFPFRPPNRFSSSPPSVM